MFKGDQKIDFLGLIPAFFFALSSILTRKGLDSSTPQTGSFVVLQTQFLLFAFALIFVDFSQFSITYSLWFFILAGFSSPALSLLFLFLSIERIGVARTNAVSNTHAIFGALSAFFILGERPSLHVWIGIILVTRILVPSNLIQNTLLLSTVVLSTGVLSTRVLSTGVLSTGVLSTGVLST